MSRDQRALVIPLLALPLACGGGGPTTPGAMPGCGPWPSQASSPYVLPYPAGETYTLIQGDCTSATHVAGTRDGYGYDFGMPIGSAVIAARSSIVGELEERFDDGNGVLSESNYVLVRHDDRTAAVYFHLTRDGALVDLGQSVAQGQLIARSGQTGGSSNGIRPHLHFGVIGRSGLTIPVTFRNTQDHPNGLQPGIAYTAF